MRQVDFEQVHACIDGLGQVQFAQRLLHQPDAAMRGAHRAAGQFILQLLAPQQGLGQVVREIEPVEPPLVPSLAGLLAMADDRVHSKSLCEATGYGLSTPIKPRETQKDFEFFTCSHENGSRGMLA